jgi:hypothetical protein
MAGAGRSGEQPLGGVDRWRETKIAAELLGKAVGREQRRDRGKVVALATIVLAAAHSAVEHLAIVAEPSQRELHIDLVAMERDLTRDGGAALVGADLKRVGVKPERIG